MTAGALTIEKVYRGINDKNCLIWCHGTPGLEHHKIKRYRYPLWKYASVSHRIVVCICTNCNMQFYGDMADGIALNIPVANLGNYFAQPIQISVNGIKTALNGELIPPFRHITQQMLNDETHNFIELVQ